MSDINQMLLEVNLFSRQSLLPRDPNYPWLVKSNTSLLDGIKFYEYCDNGNWLNFDLANNQNMIIRENIEIIRGIGGDVGPFAFFMEKDYNLILYMKSEELNRFCSWDIECDGFNLFVKKLDSEIVNYIRSI